MKIKLVLSALLLLIVAGCKPSENEAPAPNPSTNAPAATNAPASTNK